MRDPDINAANTFRIQVQQRPSSHGQYTGFAMVCGLMTPLAKSRPGRAVIAGVLILALLGLVACSARGVGIPRDQLQSIEWSKTVRSLPPSEQVLLSSYLMRHGAKGALSHGRSSVPLGETIGHAIDDEKAFEAGYAAVGPGRPSGAGHQK